MLSGSPGVLGRIPERRRGPRTHNSRIIMIGAVKAVTALCFCFGVGGSVDAFTVVPPASGQLVGGHLAGAL